MESPRNLIILYHYFHPDEVISARLYSDLAQSMAAEGWSVVAMPASRDCHSNRALQLHEQWGDVEIRRVWRPGFKQSSFLGRVLNAICMLLGWTWRAITHARSSHEVMIIGSDPILGVLAAVPWRLFRRHSVIIHWCHDLHPEAVIADGVLRKGGVVERLLSVPILWAYKSTDVIVDLGGCMRRLIVASCRTLPANERRFQTITPWALVEPSSVPSINKSVRTQLFGAVKLGCLYSGNLGRAHDFELFLDLANCLRNQGREKVAFCFAGRGPRLAKLREQVHAELTNVTFAGFAEEDALQERLAAADIHLVSLRAAWTGTVVPSKFFGAIAIGRPVLFVGSEHSAIAQWIRHHNIGWHLTADSLHDIAEQLADYAADEGARTEMNSRCFEVYQQHFSKQLMIHRWSEMLSLNVQGQRST